MRCVKRIIWILLFCLFIIELWNAPVLNSKAKIDMIKESLSGFQPFSDEIIVSTQNIPSHLIPELSKGNLTFLDPKRIQERANQKGDFMYFRFKKSSFGIIRSSIIVDHIWAVSKDSKTGHLSGGGFIVDFINVLGKMIRFERTTWIS